MDAALQALRETVYEANMKLPAYGLVLFTWGNVSAIDRERGIVAIKASGVPYEQMTVEHIAMLRLDGEVLTDHLRPSSDTPTHLALYQAFTDIGGIVHTHSTHATAWAQAGLPMPCYGTTHADDFYGEIPCTRHMNKNEVADAYEYNTGKVIIEAFAGKNPMEIPAALVAGHGPFAWGADAKQAVYKAAVLEEAARIALMTRGLNPAAQPISQHLLDRHYLRKHGAGAYYGQK